MKIKIYVGYRTESGQYVDAKAIEDLPKEEARDYINQMQIQMASTLGYEKSPVAATTKGITNNAVQI